MPQRLDALHHRPPHRHGAGEHFLLGCARWLPDPAWAIGVRKVDPTADCRRPGHTDSGTAFRVWHVAAGGAPEALTRLRVPGCRAAAVAYGPAERRASRRGGRLCRAAVRCADAARALETRGPGGLGAELSARTLRRNASARFDCPRLAWRATSLAHG